MSMDVTVVVTSSLADLLIDTTFKYVRISKSGECQWSPGSASDVKICSLIVINNLLNDVVNLDNHCCPNVRMVKSLTHCKGS